MDEFKNMDKLKDELFEAIGKICKDYKEKHEPEFKVGQWYISKSEGRKDKIYRVCRINGRYIYYDCSNIEGKSNWIAKNSVMYKSSKPATKEQIESHLRKICDEKYIGKKVKSLHDENYIQKVLQFWLYSFNEDKLWYEIDSEKHPTTNLLIYDQGKFASIIPPDKKKLPKTREELKELLRQVQDDSLLPFPTIDIDDFLDQYEI